MQKWGDPKMSDDLISKQEVLNKLNELDQQELYLPCHFKEYVIDEVSNIPQKMGRWTLDRVSYLLEYVCTNCKASFPSIASEGEFYSKLNCANMNFCPNCGAKMEEVTE